MQGNLDPLALLAGGAALDRAVDEILENFRQGPLIFNLGHGILPETPIAHVEQTLRRIRNREKGMTMPEGRFTRARRRRSRPPRASRLRATALRASRAP